MSTSVVAGARGMQRSNRPFGAVVSIAPPGTSNSASAIPQNDASLSQSTYSPVNRS
jgi:hypothetical protein